MKARSEAALIMRYIVAKRGELAPGERRIVCTSQGEIGVFNVNGQYFAVRNVCPHAGAPLCLGTLTGTRFATRPYEYTYARDGMVLRCPWHGWEFDLETGRTFFDPRVRVKTYRVVEEEGEVVLYLE